MPLNPAEVAGDLGRVRLVKRTGPGRAACAYRARSNAFSPLYFGVEIFDTMKLTFGYPA
jgi:hypothetical protein